MAGISGSRTALVHEMPHTLAALECRGALGVAGHPDRAGVGLPGRRGPAHVGRRDVRRSVAAWRARATSGSPPTPRRSPTASIRRPSSTARRKAETERTVTIRPAPDTMAYVTALLPMRQGCGGVRRAQAGRPTPPSTAAPAVRSWPTPSSNGSPAAPPRSPVPVAVNLVITDETLLGGERRPGASRGLRPDPRRGRARGWSATAVGDERSRATLRRLYRHPTSRCAGGDGIAVAALPQGAWRRSSTCATTPAAPRTATRRSATATTRSPDTATGRPAPPTGSASAKRCNYAKEAPGWQVTAGSDENGVHTAEFTTPTRHRYRSTAPPLPGSPDVEVTELEIRIGIALGKQAA